MSLLIIPAISDLAHFHQHAYTPAAGALPFYEQVCNVGWIARSLWICMRAE
jgi:hypothetical protein